MQPLFVNRKKELAEITDAAKNLKERGEGSTIIVTGEPGIGKTRLLGEAGRIAAEQGIHVIQERCTPENKAPFGVVKEVVIKGYDALRSGEVAGELLPLGLAVDTSEKMVERERLVSEQYRVFEHLYRNLVELSKATPMCVLLDDLQWADSGTIAFIHYLSRNIRKTKVMLVAAASDLEEANEFLETTVKAMNVEKTLKILRLKPLSAQDTVLLVKSTLNMEISEKLLKRVHEKTSGNPLFIIEIVQTLREKAREMEMVERVTIPQTLSAAYQKRIKALDREVRETMCLLSVLGREFTFEDACAVLGIEEDAILDSIERMIAMGFLAEKAGTEERYMFLNNPVYETLYSMVPSKTALALHKRIGEHLIATRNKEEYFEEIARHLCLAGVPECAEYYLKSAIYYLRNFAIEDCLRNAQLALEHGEKFGVPDVVKAKIYRTLGYAFSVVSEFQKGIGYYEKAMELVKDEKEIADITFYLANDYTKMARYEEALALLKKIPASALENPEVKAEALFVEGSVYFKRGNLKECLDCYTRTLEILRNLENKKLKADVLNSMGVLCQHMGNYSEAERYLLEAYKIRNELNNVREIASSCNGLGLFYLNTGHPEKGLPYLLSAEKIYNKIGDVYGLSIVINNIGIVYWARGEFSQAIEYFKREVEYTTKIGDRSGTGYGLYNIGTIYDEMGENQKAMEYYEQAEAVFAAIGERSMAGCAAAGKACMLAAMGDHGKAEELLEKVMAELMDTANSDDLVVVKMMKARALTFAGNYAVAEEFFYDVIDYFETQGKLGDLTAALTALGKMYILAGEKEKARETLTRALEVAEKIEAETWKTRIREILGTLARD
ncbi:MAG: tetratricopeptide repeat protein [Thermoplasmata archaeon]|nr:tetratricopeptide repeat protein [Thermoplasmata archaeon]